MKRFINFGSIDQFRTIVKNVQWQAQFTGNLDEDGTPIMDRSAKAPKVIAVGTEKIHGSNMAVCYSNPDGFWAQSRKNIITPEKDNAGCAFAVEANKEAWMSIINSLAKEYDIDLDQNIVSVYAEWCGGNIQKNACVSGLNKMAIIFKHFKVSPIEPQVAEDGQETAAKWYETQWTPPTQEKNFMDDFWIESPENNIYNVHNFPTLEIEVDFERPDLAQNEMIRLTEEVEKNSGVAKVLDNEGAIGEGWVWSFIDDRGNRQVWKTKGEEHAKSSGSKVKTLKPVDSVKEQAKVDFVNNHAVKEFRLQQAWQECFGIENEKMEPTVKATGDFLRFVINDVIKEESDIMNEVGLEPKEVNSMISKVARGWFMSKLDNECGL